jgi:hypothetical protein
MARITPHNSGITKGNTIMRLHAMSEATRISFMNRSMVFFSVDALLSCVLYMVAEV